MATPAAFLERLANELVKAGLPLWRIYVGLQLVHPELEAMGYMWRRGEKVQLMLPPGTRLRPALALPPPPRRHRTPAEREIGRFLHLLPPPQMDGPAALALVREWPFVESAELVVPRA